MSLNPPGSAPRRSQPVEPAARRPADLLRGVLWGLLFAAPVWVVAVVVAVWLVRTHG